MTIGSYVHIAPNALINANGGVQIGNNLTVAAGAKIFSVSNHYRNLNNYQNHTFYSFSNQVPDESQCIISGPVVMKYGSGLGTNSVILPGSTIGRNSWIGVLSSVSGKIPANVIAIGCPAKIMSDRSVK